MSRALATRRIAAPPEALLDALGAVIGSGLAPAAALSLVAAAGPTAARTARRIETLLGDRSLAEALVGAQLLTAGEAEIAEVGASSDRLGAALRWIVARRRARRARRAALIGVVIGPLTFAALGLLTEPLPAMIVGGASFAPAIRNTLLLVGGAAAVLLAPSWLLASPRLGPRLRVIASKVPLVARLLRSDGENIAASVVAAFANPRELGAAPAAARATVPAPFASALAEAAADPQLRAAAFSESFTLSLIVGVRAEALPERFAAFAAAGEEALTARLRGMVRVAAYLAAIAIAAHSAMTLISTPLSSALGNSPDLRELQQEIDSLQ